MSEESKTTQGGASAPKCKIFRLQKLLVPYPTEETWLCEDSGIRDLWEEELETGNLHDKRIKRRPLEILDRSRLQYSVQPGKSVVFIDEITDEIIAQVVSDVLSEKEMAFIERGVDKCLLSGMKKSIRVSITLDTNL